MQIHSVGIDLGKTTFHLVALGTAGKVLVRKKFTQLQLLTYTANMQTSLIGLEACSGAHFPGWALRKQGHDGRLIAAQFVKPFVVLLWIPMLAQSNTGELRLTINDPAGLGLKSTVKLVSEGNEYRHT